MAEPNWEAYARAYGGQNQGQTSAAHAAGAALGEGFKKIPGIEERLNTSSQEALEIAFRPLMDYVSLPVEQWADIDTMGGTGGIPSAGSAYFNWKNSLSPRHQRIAKRKGLLNPIAFKQMYDSQMEMILPEIKNKLNSYKTMNNKTDADMKKLFKDKKGLNAFLLQNTSQEELATTSGYLAPDQTWAQWAEQKGGALGIGGRLAGVTAIGAAGVVPRAGGVPAAMNRYERFKSPTGLSKKDTIALESAAKKTGFGDLATKRSERVKSKNVKNAKSVLTKAQNKYKKAEKAYKGKKFSATKNAKNLKSSINTAKSNLSAANKTPVKNAKDVLNRAIKKHGKGKVIKMMAKKLGARGAIGLLAKTGLAAAGPIGTLVGGGLLMADIAAIYTILSDLAE